MDHNHNPEGKPYHQNHNEKGWHKEHLWGSSDELGSALHYVYSDSDVVEVAKNAAEKQGGDTPNHVGSVHVVWLILICWVHGQTGVVEHVSSVTGTSNHEDNA